MKLFRAIPLAGLGVAASIGLALPAQSAPLHPISAATLNAAQAGNVEAVQYRHGWRHRPYYRRGPSAGAVIGGLAAGAIIGGAIASSQAQARSDAVSYCSQRYRSYDPASGTYLGYDGYRHPCP